MIKINLISNPRFINGLSDWSKKSSNSATTVATLSTGGIDNSRCVRINVAANGAQNGIWQSNMLSPGIYTLSFYAKKVSGNADLHVEIDYGEYSFTSNSFASDLESEFKKFVYTFTLPGSYRDYMMVSLLAGGSEGVILLDDVELMVPLRESFGLKYATVNLTTNLQSGLNVRAAMQSNAEVIGYWPHGRRALVLPTEDASWYECRYRGNVGYVKAEFLTDFEPAMDSTDFGSYFASSNRLTEIAEYEVDASTSAHPKFYSKNATPQQEWCHMFADWISGHNCWVPDAAQHFPYVSNCRDGVRWFLQHAEFLFVDADNKAKVRAFPDFSNLISSDALTSEEINARALEGDYVYFASSNEDEVARHVALVISWNSSSIEIVEGNISASDAPNDVRIRTILKSNFSSEGILGFGRPQRYSRG